MMSGFFKAAWATQSVAALMLDFSNSLRSIANAVEAKKTVAIPRQAGRDFDISTPMGWGARPDPISIFRKGLFSAFVNVRVCGSPGRIQVFNLPEERRHIA